MCCSYVVCQLGNLLNCSFVKCSETCLLHQGAHERLTRAMDVLVIGEAMRREAQICIDVSRVRKEAAEKLLLKFEAVLEPLGSEGHPTE